MSKYTELTSIIREHFGTAPEAVMDPRYTKRCQELSDEEDPVLFLRNLRDELVHTSGSSELVITLCTTFLGSYPEETPQETVERRQRLQERLSKGE